MIILAVDPGLRGCGCALFLDNALIAAEYVAGAPQDEKNLNVARRITTNCVIEWFAHHFRQAWEKTALHSWQLVAEEMQVYRSSQRKGGQRALIQLALIVGALEHFAPASHLVQPHVWKGSVDGDVMLRRIMQRLDAHEKATIVHHGAKDHNAIDAIGIGLYYLGRLEPVRVFAR